MTSEMNPIPLPLSKSVCNRWLILNHLANGKFHFPHISSANDSQVMHRLLQKLQEGETGEYNCEDAGSVARFLLPLLALCTSRDSIPGQRYILRGTNRLHQRPIAPLVETLKAAGAEIRYLEQQNLLPVEIIRKEPLSRKVEINRSQSSQFVSALLMVGGFLPQGLEIHLTGNHSSQPYIDMTLGVLKEAGIPVETLPQGWDIKPARIQEKDIRIEADWSAAAFFYNLAILQEGKPFLLQGLREDSLQGDSLVKEIYQPWGVESTFTPEGCRILCRERKTPAPLEIDLRHHPDLAPALAAICVATGREALLKGVSSLRHKESNRMHALREELTKIGGEISCSEHEILIRKSTPHPYEGEFHTWNDHRIAMALGSLKPLLGSLKPLLGSLRMDHPEVVAKSFPEFWNLL